MLMDCFPRINNGLEPAQTRTHNRRDRRVDPSTEETPTTPRPSIIVEGVWETSIEHNAMVDSPIYCTKGTYCGRLFPRNPMSPSVSIFNSGIQWFRKVSKFNSNLTFLLPVELKHFDILMIGQAQKCKHFYVVVDLDNSKNGFIKLKKFNTLEEANELAESLFNTYKNFYEETYNGVVQ